MHMPSSCAVKGIVLLFLFPLAVAAGSPFIALYAIYLAGLVIPQWLWRHGK